jgi:hypothetical protein
MDFKMTIVKHEHIRHFALNLVRNAKDKKSVKTRRKLAGWDSDYFGFASR